jgi:hypothetical protein
VLLHFAYTAHNPLPTIGILKKNQTNLGNEKFKSKSSVESFTSRQDQAEEGMIWIEDKVDELPHSTVIKNKKSNTVSMRHRIYIDEGKELHAEGIENLFNGIIENFPNIGKDMGIQVQEAFRTPDRCGQKIASR